MKRSSSDRRNRVRSPILTRFNSLRSMSRYSVATETRRWAHASFTSSSGLGRVTVWALLGGVGGSPLLAGVPVEEAFQLGCTDARQPAHLGGLDEPPTDEPVDCPHAHAQVVGGLVQRQQR